MTTTTGFAVVKKAPYPSFEDGTVLFREIVGVVNTDMLD
jgi:hypothetical protein